MIVKDYLDKLVHDIKRYTAGDVQRSIELNKHLTRIDGYDLPITRKVSDAVLVDFANQTAFHFGCDLALSVTDLWEHRKITAKPDAIGEIRNILRKYNFDGGRHPQEAVKDLINLLDRVDDWNKTHPI